MAYGHETNWLGWLARILREVGRGLDALHRVQFETPWDAPAAPRRQAPFRYR